MFASDVPVRVTWLSHRGNAEMGEFSALGEPAPHSVHAGNNYTVGAPAINGHVLSKAPTTSDACSRAPIRNSGCAAGSIAGQRTAQAMRSATVQARVRRVGVEGC